jgi:lipopolysaccharide export system protein LptA
MKIPAVWITAVLCLFSFPLIFEISLATSEEKTPLILEGAEYIRQKQVDGKRVVILEGDVRWLRGGSRLRCGHAKYYEEDGLLFLSEDVHLIGEDRDIFADSVQYFREREYAVVMGHIIVKIADGDIMVRADSMDYALADNESWAFKRPELTLSNNDSEEKVEDEVTVVGDILHMVEDSFVTVVGKVDILGDSLTGRSDSLDYNMKLEKIILFGNPWIDIGSYMLEGERIDLYVHEKILSRGLSSGNARGEQKKTVQDKEDNEDEIVNWIEADSISLSFLDDRIDSLEASSNARAFFRVHGEEKVEDNYVIGDNILLVWEEDEVDMVQVSGQGKGVYHKKDDEKE